MKFGERIAALDRLQKSRFFKLIATAVIVLAGAGGFVTYLVKYRETPAHVEYQPPPAAPTSAQAPEKKDAAGGTNNPVVQSEVASAEDAQMRVAAKVINDILSHRADPTRVGVTIASAVAFAVLAVWLGLGIWYAILALLLWAIYAAGQNLSGLGGWATFLVGVGSLWAIFLALIAGVRILLSAPHPIFSIARNTLDQAVRMKISAIFVVLLVFLLASMPLLLDPGQNLRYRVQSFLQYGIGLSYTIIATLTALFSVYTVATEQRDRVIWQTVTKPVSASSYVLGKWLGVVSLSAVLIAVTGGAVFMFTEYLRASPAEGEKNAYVAEDGGYVTPDRKILETQILTARVPIAFNPPAIDENAFNENVDSRVKAEQMQRPNFGKDPADRQFIADELRKAVMIEYRSIEPGHGREYVFDGLKEAKERGLPVILRYRPESGSNRPDLLYSLTFLFPANGASALEKVALAQAHNIWLSPNVIDKDGRLKVEIVNGDYFNRVSNGGTIYFAPDALEVSFSAGSYRMNFMRVFVVLWLKTAFVAMAGIFCATFLSFSVASLTTFGIFLVAESSRFITDARENWNITDNKGHEILLLAIVDRVAGAVSAPLRFYADLKPTQRLVDGLLLPWSSIFTGGLLLILLTVILFSLASYVFRSRELAVYSGH
ncbi:MAG: hypothetical protein U0573_13745 [Phycisphaerales bacterium]|nr:hypothetical protein [Planctomycetota bacterium]